VCDGTFGVGVPQRLCDGAFDVGVPQHVEPSYYGGSTTCDRRRLWGRVNVHGRPPSDGRNARSPIFITSYVTNHASHVTRQTSQITHRTIQNVNIILITNHKNIYFKRFNRLSVCLK